MKTRSLRKALVIGTIPFVLLFLFSTSHWTAQASRLLGPTPYVPPAQGCDAATGVGADYKTCAFYVAINEDDAGNKPECNNYGISWPEIYLGRCNSGGSIVSGFRFQNVTLPTNLSILASYIEFTVDGPYGANNITANIYGQASLVPNSFTGTSSSDIIVRPTVQPTATWRIPSTNTIYNMGDSWELGETRRTPDVTRILTAIMSQPGWQSNNPVAFLFKNMDLDLNSANSRRVLAKERIGFNPARLVVRVGQIPRASVSWYIQRAQYTKRTNKTTFDLDALKAKARIEAQKNQPVLVILNFGAPLYNSTTIGTKLTSTEIPVSISEIQGAVQIYLNEFYFYASQTQYSQASLTLGVGTNNSGDLFCLTNSRNHGVVWGDMIDYLNTYVSAQGYASKINVVGAIDIETWAPLPDGSDPYRQLRKCGNQFLPEAPPESALNWAQGYSDATEYRYYNFGEFNNAASGTGLNSWGADLFWELSWGIPEAYPFPEMYRTDGELATTWQQLARYSAICRGPSSQTQCQPEVRAANPNWTKGRFMKFDAVLTQYTANECPTNTNRPEQGWQQLYGALATDFNTDGYFIPYSSDINFDLKYDYNNPSPSCPLP
jgi:hypothetical protein